MHSRLSLIAALGLLCLAGCGPAKLDETKNWTLNSETPARAMDLSAQPKPQTFTVEFTATGGDVSVFVFKEEDAKGEDGLAYAPASKALGSKTASTGDSFKVDVPANTATRVIARAGGRKVELKIHVTNR